jgi:hypothetical protein
MDTLPNTTPKRPLSPVWYKVGAVLFVMVVAVLFLMFASARMRHRLFDEVPPGGAVPGERSPALPQ